MKKARKPGKSRRVAEKPIAAARLGRTRTVQDQLGKLYLAPLGLAAEIRYTHAGDKQRYRHTFKRSAPTYFTTIGGKAFVMIRVPRMVTRNKRPYIGD